MRARLAALAWGAAGVAARAVCAGVYLYLFARYGLRLP